MSAISSVRQHLLELFSVQRNYYLELRTLIACMCAVHLQLRGIVMKKVMIDEHHATINTYVVDDVSMSWPLALMQT